MSISVRGSEAAADSRYWAGIAGVGSTAVTGTNYSASGPASHPSGGASFACRSSAWQNDALGGEYSFAAVSSSRRPSSGDRCCGPPTLRRWRWKRPPALIDDRRFDERIRTRVGHHARRDDRVLLFDVVVIGRRPHEPSTRETAPSHLTFYVSLAVAFGLWTWFFHGSQFGVEFFAGWLTEYSLSVDNLFIFLIIMASFKVPQDLPAAGAARRHHPGVDLPRHLHRARRGGDRAVLLGLLHLRCVPGLHRVQAGPRHRAR